MTFEHIQLQMGSASSRYQSLSGWLACIW